MFQFLQGRPICGIRSRTVRIQNLSGFYTEKRGESRNIAGEWLGRRVTSILSWLYKAGAKESRHDNRRKSMLSLLANQCSFVTGQRLRRAYQIGELYSNLYAEHTRWRLVGSFWRRLHNKHCKVGKLVAALAGVFMWEDEKIRDEEIRRSAEELQMMELMKNQTTCPAQTPGLEDSGWEIVMEKENFYVWRRPILNSHLYEYRVLGTYNDITPRQFFNVQLDTEYRKKWDSLVIKLEVVDRDANTGSEVVHWATHFPYPMYSRDYVYVRRFDVDVEKNLMVLVSRSVEHPFIPETKDFVRVRSYESQMVIRPHKSFDENGFDYLLTYRDDPQTVFPRYCLSWMVSSGMPDFLEKLHTAALRARNQEVGMQDYMGMVKPAQEFHSADARHAGGPSRMEYA